jgi:hypothetical protein
MADTSNFEKSIRDLAKGADILCMAARAGQFLDKNYDEVTKEAKRWGMTSDDFVARVLEMGLKHQQAISDAEVAAAQKLRERAKNHSRSTEEVRLPGDKPVEDYHYGAVKVSRPRKNPDDMH